MTVTPAVLRIKGIKIYHTAFYKYNDIRVIFPRLVLKKRILNLENVKLIANYKCLF